MPKTVPRVVRRGGSFYFRMAVPRHLKATFQKGEVKFSLRTLVPTEARVRGRLLSNAVDLLFEELPRMPNVKPEIIQECIRTYFQDAWSQSRLCALEWPTDKRFDLISEVQSLQSLISRMRVQLAEQSFDDATRIDAASLLVSSVAAPGQADLESIQVACGGVLRAKIENYRILKAMLTGHYSDAVPNDPLFFGMSEPNLPPMEGDIVQPPIKMATLASSIQLFISQKAGIDWVRKTENDVRRTLSLACTVIGGERPIVSIGISDVKAVRDALRLLPANYSKLSANKGLAIQEVIGANTGTPTLSVKTQDKYFTMFRQFLIWCEAEGLIEKVPGSGVKVAGVGKLNPVDRRHPYSTEQLDSIFRSPVFNGHSHTSRNKAGAVVTKDGKFWIPLIALYSGMRMGEIVQLLKSDLKEEKGVCFFDVSKVEGDGKQLKTDNSKRRVPVHSKLLALGLIDFAKPIKPHMRMFSEIEPGKDGYFSHNFSKWWGRYSRDAGFKTSRTAFHSFRHNFKDALQGAGAPEAVSKALMGHSDNSVHASYGSGPELVLLKVWIDRIRFKLPDGLGTSVLSP